MSSNMYHLLGLSTYVNLHASTDSTTANLLIKEVELLVDVQRRKFLGGVGIELSEVLNFCETQYHD